MDKIGQEITQKRTSGLNAKDRQDFERFVKERRQKQKKEDGEEKLAGKMRSDEGDATATDLTRQTEELAKEKHAFKTNQDVEVEDIETE